MREFKDAVGRTWELAVTIGAAKRIKDKLGVDLLQLNLPAEGDDRPILTRLGMDELLLGEIICCLIGEAQFEKQDVTADQVVDAFDGKTVLAAQKAFYEELLDFFRQRGRKFMATAIEKQVATIDAAAKKAETILADLDPETLISVPESLNSVPESLTSGKMFGESPGKLESTPDR